MTVHTEQDLRDALVAEDREAPIPAPEQLIAGVRVRIRRQRRLAGAGTLIVLAAAGLGVGLMLTAGGHAQPGPAAPPIRQSTQVCAQPGCAPTLTRTVQRQLHRPLRLPTMASDGTCPVTPGTNYTGPDVGGQRYGHGPVSLVIGDSGDPTRGITHLGISDRKGWLAAENVLLIDGTYHGAVSVRARQLNGPGVPSLGGAPGPTTYILPPVGNDPGSYPSNADGSRTPPMTIWTKTPGCYGFQIDGQTFTETLVIDLTSPRTPQALAGKSIVTGRFMLLGRPPGPRPLPGQITAVGAGVRRSVRVGTDGRYRLVLPHGTYTFQGRSPRYVHGRRTCKRTGENPNVMHYRLTGRHTIVDVLCLAQ